MAKIGWLLFVGVAGYVAAFPPWDIPLAGILSLAAFGMAFQGPVRFGAARIGLVYAAGVALFAGGCWWLTDLHPSFPFLMAIFEGLSLPLACLLFRLARRGPRPLPSWLALPVAWCAVEYLRSVFPLDGFPWLLLGYVAWRWEILVQIADVTGVFGLSFLLAMAAGLLVSWMEGLSARGGRKTFPWIGAAVFALLLAATVLYGWIRPSSLEAREGPLVAAVQGNVPQELKDDTTLASELLSRYTETTRWLFRPGMEEKPSLVIWPETLFPYPLGEGKPGDEWFARYGYLESLRVAQAAGLRYYGIPGIGIPHTTGFNYIEPPEGQAWMREDEYDELIKDPTGFLYNVWLPRVSAEVSRIGEASTYRNNLALVKSSMAMLQYFYAFGPQIGRLRAEAGTASAIAGIFKAPFDIIADKLRGYLGLTMDMATQPDKVLRACEALMPHLCHVGLTTADPTCRVPIGFWMHRGCVPFVNPKTFDSHYWTTLKPVIEEFWKHGHQTLFYAEGKWRHHFDTFRELPDRSIVFHCDQDDVFEVHKKLHDKFALSGGIPNILLSFGKPEEVRGFTRRVLREVARDGGYILDAGAIMQDDTSVENLRAMTEIGREEGGYSAGSYAPPTATPPCEGAASLDSRRRVNGMTGRPAPRVKPGVCLPWEEKVKELPPITGDPDLVRKVWEDIEALGNTYIWQLLLSF